MKRLLILATLVFLPIIATAEKLEGIEGSNYKVSFSGDDSDNGSGLSLGYEARFPVANYTGMSLNARLSEFDGDGNSLDSSNKSIGLGVFLRKYALGIVNANYSHSEAGIKSHQDALKYDYDVYSLSGTYYIEKFDLSLSRSTNVGSGNDFNFSNFNAAYYVNDNIRVSASVGGMDGDESYSLSTTYQPKVFNNAISILASYQDTNIGDSYGITISYYFNTKVNLINRIRRY